MSKTSYKSIKLVKFCYWKFMEYVVCLYKTKHTTEKLRRKIDNEITRFLPRKVIFDFSNVAFMDSAGIGMLLGRYKVIKMLGGQLELMNVNKQVEKVFEISGILKIIPLIKNNEENVG